MISLPPKSHLAHRVNSLKNILYRMSVIEDDIQYFWGEKDIDFFLLVLVKKFKKFQYFWNNINYKPEFPEACFILKIVFLFLQIVYSKFVSWRSRYCRNGFILELHCEFIILKMALYINWSKLDIFTKRRIEFKTMLDCNSCILCLCTLY